MDSFDNLFFDFIFKINRTNAIFWLYFGNMVQFTYILGFGLDKWKCVVHVEDVLMDIVSEAIRNVADSSKDAVACFDEYGKCIYVNKKAIEFIGGDNVIEGLEQYYEECAAK